MRANEANGEYPDSALPGLFAYHEGGIKRCRPRPPAAQLWTDTI